jgi:hypothetical protein
LTTSSKEKGKRLVAVLHGSRGVCKTLTAESIAELLQCPPLHASAGEQVNWSGGLTMMLDLAHT